MHSGKFHLLVTINYEIFKEKSRRDHKPYCEEPQTLRSRQDKRQTSLAAIQLLYISSIVCNFISNKFQNIIIFST